MLKMASKRSWNKKKKKIHFNVPKTVPLKYSVSYRLNETQCIQKTKKEKKTHTNCANLLLAINTLQSHRRRQRPRARFCFFLFFLPRRCRHSDYHRRRRRLVDRMIILLLFFFLLIFTGIYHSWINSAANHFSRRFRNNNHYDYDNKYYYVIRVVLVALWQCNIILVWQRQPASRRLDGLQSTYTAIARSGVQWRQ